MASLPISEIVQVNVSIQQGVAALEDFGLTCLFTEYGSIADYSVYPTLDELLSDFPGSNSVANFGTAFFSQSPTPTQLAVAKVDVTAGDTWPARVQAVKAELDFYVCCVDAVDGDLTSQTVLNIAQYVQTQTMIFVYARGAADILTINSSLQALNFDRTALIMKDDGSSSATTTRLDAAWVGKCITQTPGSLNWANQELTGVTVSALSATQLDSFLNVGVNVYATVGNINVTRRGRTCANAGTFSFLDQIQAKDYLQISIEEDIEQLVLNSTKIPYTDAGMKSVIAVVLNRCNIAISENVLDGAVRPTATAPSVFTVPVEQRAQRIAPTITVTARLSGAINSFYINIPVEI